MNRGFIQPETIEEFSQSREDAMTLFSSLKQAGKISKGISLARWEREFRLMRSEDGVEEEDLQKILKWYCDNITDKYIPHVYSAGGFREKFARIRQAYQRENPEDFLHVENPKCKPQGILRQLSALEWPVSSRGHILATIQVSLDSYEAWIKRIHSLIDLPPHLERFRAYLISKLPPSDFQILQWMRWVHRNVVSRDNWNGDLIGHAWNEKHSHWRIIGHKWSCEWCGNGSLYNQLAEKIYENSKD